MIQDLSQLLEIVADTVKVGHIEGFQAQMKELRDAGIYWTDHCPPTLDPFQTPKGASWVDWRPMGMDPNLNYICSGLWSLHWVNWLFHQSFIYVDLPDNYELL